MNGNCVRETLEYIMNNGDDRINDYLGVSNEHQLALLECINRKYITGLNGHTNIAGGAVFETIGDVSVTDYGKQFLSRYTE